MQFEDFEIKDDKTYVVVSDKFQKTNTLDISVFTEEEWEELKRISNTFLDKCRTMERESDESYMHMCTIIPHKYTNAIYYLHYKGFTDGFQGLHHLLLKGKYINTCFDILNIHDHDDEHPVKNNMLREWIKDNHKKIIEHHDYISQCVY